MASDCTLGISFSQRDVGDFLQPLLTLLLLVSPAAACTRDEVDTVFKAAKDAQHAWAKTPLWQRAQYLHKVATLMRQHAQPMADCLVKEIAKPAKDSMTEVIRSADLIDYTAEEGLRCLGEGQLLMSDSFIGQKRNKLCLVSKVQKRGGAG